MNLSIKRFFKSKEVNNASWLIGGKILQMILTLIVGVLTARYLGPANQGLVDYGLAYVSFFAAFSNLGINSIIMKEFVDNPDEQGEAIGSALVLKLLSGFMSMVVIFCVSFFLDKGDWETILIVFLCSVGILFHVFDTFNYWFQAQYKAKVTAITVVVAYAIVSAYKILLLALGKGVEWFAISTAVDYFAYAVIIVIFYKTYNGPKLKFSFKKAKGLLKLSYNYILSALMVSIYTQTDKIMLKTMIDETQVGYYGRASAICTMWVFILTAIIDSIFPTILRLKGVDEEEYKRKNRQLYAIVFYVCLFVSVFFVILSEFCINVLYGEAYLPAANTLRICTLYTAFSYLGVARNAWIVSEHKQKYLKHIYLGAAIINIALNAIFIPLWKSEGAAFASLVSQILTGIVLPLLIKPLRPNGVLMLEAIALQKIRSPKKVINVEGLRKISLEEIKQTELEILDYIDRVCKENDIQYFLFAGTLLGAVRHKGFIPWDDDIDIFMTRENYDKFISVTRYNSGRYQTKALETDKDYYLPFIKVIDNTTVAVDSVNKNTCEMGVWVDIFPLDNYVEDEKYARKRRMLFYKFGLTVGQRFYASSGSKLRNFVKRLAYLFYFKKSPRKYALKINEYSKKFNGQKTDKLLMTAEDTKKNINLIEKNWIERAVLLDFEGKKYPAPIEYDKALTRKFGEYMTLPPEDKRVAHNSYQFYSKD